MNTTTQLPNIGEQKLWDFGEFSPPSFLPYIAEDFQALRTMVDRTIRTYVTMQWYYTPQGGSVQFRGPIEHRDSSHGRRSELPIDTWHKDCGLTGWFDGYLVIWSNELPTELRDGYTHEEVQLEAGHMYAFDNQWFEHRRPIMTPHNNRYFIRSYIHRGEQ